jgi:hypothetical protein
VVELQVFKPAGTVAAGVVVAVVVGVVVVVVVVDSVVVYAITVVPGEQDGVSGTIPVVMYPFDTQVHHSLPGPQMDVPTGMMEYVYVLLIAPQLLLTSLEVVGNVALYMQVHTLPVSVQTPTPVPGFSH